MWVREQGKTVMFILPGSSPDYFFKQNLLVMINLQLGKLSTKSYAVQCHILNKLSEALVSSQITKRKKKCETKSAGIRLKIIDCVHCQYLQEILGFFFFQCSFGNFCRVSPHLSLLSGSTVSLHTANTSLTLASRTTSMNRKTLSGLGFLTFSF